MQVSKGRNTKAGSEQEHCGRKYVWGFPALDLLGVGRGEATSPEASTFNASIVDHRL